MYAPESPFTVHCYDCWWSDRRDPLSYGRDFDFSRPFFEQFYDLLKAVPKSCLLNFIVDNSEYCNYTNESRNCHLCYGAGYMEDCLYMDWSYYGKDTLDSSYCTNFELGYMNVDCSDSYNCKFCQDCNNVSDCQRCFDLRNCKNCFGCAGLRNKEYYIFNKPYSKEEYMEMLPRLEDPKNADKALAEFNKLKMSIPRQASRMVNNENCVGNNILNSRNATYCYDAVGLEDCKYMCDVFKGKDSMDTNRTGETELTYFITGGGYYRNILYTAISCDLKDAIYCYECCFAKNAFGSVGLNHNEYCILNKQYTPDEYNALVPKIIEHMRKTGEWGHFFPSSLSPFSYNESLAQEFFPSTKEACLSKGFRWRDPDTRDYKTQTYKVPANIRDVPDSIVNEVLACRKTGRNFKITPQELKFYRKQGLPIPDLCPDQRYLERLSLKNPRKLWDRECGRCGTAIKTTYAPDRLENVYCEACYLKEVY